MALLAGIEAGGTKFVCAVGSEAGDILRIERFPTTDPDQTINRSIDFFTRAAAELESDHGKLAGLGIGAFGPVDLNRKSATYGHITSTPKPGWQNTSLLPRIAEALQVPAAFDTDVNAAAIGEGAYGAAKGLENFLYLTVGTGVGGGVIANGKPLHGMVHPELGHVLLPRLENDEFPGSCPYHGSCVEGLCAGPAIEARWGKPAIELGKNHEAWDIEAAYLARAIMAYSLILSPERIILGGGVMHQRQLFPKIRREVKTLLAGYVDHPNITREAEDYILPPGLEDEAGIRGALLMAYQAANGSKDL